MHVRLLSGRYAGEVRDIRADAARAMLEDGRAVLPAANGGPVSAGKPVLVGEHVEGSSLPASVVARFEGVAKGLRATGEGVHHFHVSGKRKKA